MNLDEMKETIYVITGEKDHDELFNYIVNVLSELNLSGAGILKTFKLYYKEFKNLRQALLKNFPEHLLPLTRSIVDNESQTKHFNENFVQKRNVKDYSNYQELLNAIMTGT